MKTFRRLTCLLVILPTIAFAQFPDGDAKTHFSHPLELRVATEFLSSEKQPVWAASVNDGLRALPNVVPSKSGECEYLLVLAVSPSQGGYACAATVLMDAKAVVSTVVPAKAWTDLRKANLVRMEDIAPVNDVLEKAVGSMSPCFIVGGSVLGSGSSAHEAVAQCLGRFDSDFLATVRKSDRGMRNSWNAHHP